MPPPDASTFVISGNAVIIVSGLITTLAGVIAYLFKLYADALRRESQIYKDMYTDKKAENEKLLDLSRRMQASGGRVLDIASATLP